MAKRKKAGLTIADLVTLAEETGFDPEILAEDLEEAADLERDLTLEGVRESDLREQLMFLWRNGWELGRLEEIIRKKSADPFAD